MKKIFTIFGFLLALGALTAHAAVITAGVPSVTLDTQGESVNAIDLHLSFNPAEFAVTSIDDGGSAVSVWVNRPSFSNDAGTIDLAGIIPGGLNTPNAKIVSITVVPKRPSGTSKGFSLKSGQVLLNDGLGTPAKLSFTAQAIALNAVVATSTDLIAPDPFLPEVGKDPNIFDGDYFLVFGTTDQGSGIDHYEVLEVPKGQTVGDIVQWQAATSPYRLHDQSLNSTIYVRAIDHAGNLRMVTLGEVAPPVGRPGSREFAIALAIASGILLIGISLHLWKRKRHG